MHNVFGARPSRGATRTRFADLREHVVRERRLLEGRHGLRDVRTEHGDLVPNAPRVHLGRRARRDRGVLVVEVLLEGGQLRVGPADVLVEARAELAAPAAKAAPAAAAKAATPEAAAAAAICNKEVTGE